MPEQAFIALGSNIQPEEHLPRAVAHLGEVGCVVAVSSVYQNPAVGPTSQPDYLNAAVLVETELPPVEVRRRLRAIERELGRVRTADKDAPRTIDLDLVFFGSHVLEEAGLTIPDPKILSRAHLAVPLAEVSPAFRHPLTGETLQAIAARLRPGARMEARPDVVLLPAS